MGNLQIPNQWENHWKIKGNPRTKWTIRSLGKSSSHIGTWGFSIAWWLEGKQLRSMIQNMCQSPTTSRKGFFCGMCLYGQQLDEINPECGMSSIHFHEDLHTHYIIYQLQWICNDGGMTIPHIYTMFWPWHTCNELTIWIEGELSIYLHYCWWFSRQTWGFPTALSYLTTNIILG